MFTVMADFIPVSVPGRNKQLGEIKVAGFQSETHLHSIWLKAAVVLV
jgi:hypothetical protein